jgi:type II restriction enzyme
MTGKLAAAYTSGAQRARVVTEAWGEANLYCPNCSAPKLSRLEHNTQVSDFSCPNCKFWFQLKGQKTRLGDSITDGAYTVMMQAIQNDETPNFYFMHYELATWHVKNLLLVPSFAFPPSAIIKRKPLSVTARRAGWVGCNIALHRIPLEVRIAVVTDNQAAPASEVREQFKRVKPLKDISVKQRGWTLDVLNIVRRLTEEKRQRAGALQDASRDSRITGQRGSVLDCGGPPPLSSASEFTNEEVYAFASELEKLYPDNRHIRDKIRQQLQVLRDAKLLIHVGSGVWRLP